MNTKELQLCSLAFLFSLTAAPAFSDDIGSGRDEDTPYAAPSDPAETNTISDAWQTLFEWFYPHNNNDSE